MDGATVLVNQADGIVTMTLNRPEARNALNLEMRRELEAALRTLGDDPTVRVLILQGAGEHFCAGGDVKSMQASRMSAGEGQGRVEAMNRAVAALARFRTPTIAMVDGFAVGVGCNLALACDLVIASDRARFGEIFARLGLIPDGGGPTSSRVASGCRRRRSSSSPRPSSRPGTRRGSGSRARGGARSARPSRWLAESPRGRRGLTPWRRRC